MTLILLDCEFAVGVVTLIEERMPSLTAGAEHLSGSFRDVKQLFNGAGQ
jgi:hypothetical protein